MKTSSNKEFESALLKQLSKFDMKEDLLKRVSSDITSLHGMEILPEKVWVIGKPDPSDFVTGVVVQSRIKATAIDRLKDLLRLKELISVEIFPVGIIRPDALDVEISLGNIVGGAQKRL